jgi:hypothetical protein
MSTLKRYYYTEQTYSIPNHHRKVQFSTQPSPILMKVGELVVCKENSILAKFQHPMTCSFCGATVKNPKKLHFLAHHLR